MKIIKIGKASTNDIVINGDPTVSRVHMQMFIDDEANVFVTDLESMNGTFVNGVKIFGSVKLNTYDILKIGNSLVNWKELLLDDVDAQGAYETIVDENKQNLLISSDDIDVYEQSSKTSNRRKKKTKYIWYATAFLVVIGGLNVYFNSDSQLIVDEWTSKNNPELSYTFNNDGTFSKDSAGIIKEGSYKLIAGRDKQLELSFNDESLPVFEKTFTSDNTPKLAYPDVYMFNTDVSDEYFGNLFEFKNNSKDSINILRIEHDIYNKNIPNIETKVFICAGSYKRLRLIDDPYDKSWQYFESDNDFQLMRDNTLTKDIIIGPNETISLFIVSNSCVNVTSLAKAEIWQGNNDFELSNFVKSQTVESNLYIDNRVLVWNGNIVYGLMQENFEYSYNFIDGYLEINGELYKKN